MGEVDEDGFDAQGRIWRAVYFGFAKKEYRSFYLRKNGTMPTAITAKGNIAEYSSDCGRFTHAVVGSDDPSYPVVGTGAILKYINESKYLTHGRVSKGGYKGGDILLKNGHVAVLLGFDDLPQSKVGKGKLVHFFVRIFSFAQASLGDHPPQFSTSRKINFSVFARPNN